MSAAEAEVSSAPSRSREATRARLVEAATALFAADGLHSVTSAQIARAAGVATGTFYLHFKDKHALFREIALAAVADLRDRQQRAAEGTAPGSYDEFRAYQQEMVAYAADNRDLIRVAFGRGGESAEIGDVVIDELVPQLVERLTERRARGEIPADVHPELAAQGVAGQTIRMLAWWCDHPERASREEMLQSLLAMNPFRPGRAGSQS